jgi:hypothetical protein
LIEDVRHTLCVDETAREEIIIDCASMKKNEIMCLPAQIDKVYASFKKKTETRIHTKRLFLSFSLYFDIRRLSEKW